jgi:hypothetical protein
VYTGPIMRTYGSMYQYRDDAANMARFGYQVMNVQEDKVTNGCALAAILIIGLLLTPVCIGIIVLLFLPTAFGSRITAHYYYAGIAGDGPQRELPPPSYYPQKTLPPPNVPARVTVQLQPAARGNGNRLHDDYDRGPSGFAGLSGLVDQLRYWYGNLTPGYRALVIAAGILALGVGLVFVVALIQTFIG